MELWHSSYDGRKSSYLRDSWNTLRASVHRLSLENGRVVGACDMRDFSLWSPHVHCLWLVARRSLDGGPGVSPHLTSRRDREGKGQGRELNLYIHACRGCSSTTAPPSVMSQPEAVLVRNPKTAIPHTHGCWKHFATVLICSDVVTERQLYVLPSHGG